MQVRLRRKNTYLVYAVEIL